MPDAAGETFALPGDQPSAAGPVDLRAAFEAVGGDIDILTAAVAIALQEIPQQMAELKAALSRGETQVVAAEAHRLKGIMASLGGAQAREHARCLEAMDEHKMQRGGPDLLTDLEREVGRVMAFYADPPWTQRARPCQEGIDG
jgi:HPt (histidine-containing phosphotransfer) domain-containing protein